MERIFYEVAGRGEQSKVVREIEKARGGEGLEEDLSREEIRRAMGKLKDGKAAGIDGIPSEAWKYEGEGLEE